MRARRRARAAGLRRSRAPTTSRPIGFPLLVKASAGGGGRGMRIVRTAAELDDALASRRARGGRGVRRRHRVLRALRRARPPRRDPGASPTPTATSSSLLERECSIQRRHQKIIEESPSPAVDADLRAPDGRRPPSPRRRAVGYVGAGTVEFLLDPDGDVLLPRDEHPAAGRAPGDRDDHRARPRRAAARVADGAPLAADALAARRGHAIEVRLTAEDPAAGYRPSTGTFTASTTTAAASASTAASSRGSAVSPFYDSMIAKVIAHGATRDGGHPPARPCWLAGPGCTARSRTATSCSTSCGTRRSSPATCTPASSTSTRAPTRRGDVASAAAAAALAEQAANRRAAAVLAGIPSGWRNNPAVDQVVELALDERRSA